MKKVIQRVEDFYAPGTFGEEEGITTLESVIRRVNSEEWRVDQIVPLSFRSPSVSVAEGMDVIHGIVLCSKIE